MNLTGIISISGKPGLSKIVSQTRTGLIVESLIDGKRTAVHGAERVSSLEDISIYTYEEDMLLADVLEKMKEKASEKAIISHKVSNDELKSYLKEVLPNYDEDRVYASDIKKLIQWYSLLESKGLLEESKEKEEKGETKKTASKKTSDPKKKATGAKKPVQKATSKAAAPPKKTSPKGAAKGR